MIKKESYEGSEMERFEKALARCRNCNHIKMIHSFLNCNKGICIDYKLDVTGKSKRCKCKIYEPIDNLEFLEFKLDKKGKNDYV